jgi:hypothetical protein
MLVIAVSFVFAVMVAPAVVVSLTLAVPAVIMIEPAMLSFPVAVIISAALPARSHPHCAAVRSKRPITAVPNVAAVYHVPIAVNPYVVRARGDRSHPVHTRRRWSADSNSDGHLSFKGRRACQKHCGKQRCANKLSHDLSSFEKRVSTPTHKTLLTTFSLGWIAKNGRALGRPSGCFQTI